MGEAPAARASSAGWALPGAARSGAPVRSRSALESTRYRSSRGRSSVMAADRDPAPRAHGHGTGARPIASRSPGTPGTRHHQPRRPPGSRHCANATPVSSAFSAVVPAGSTGRCGCWNGWRVAATGPGRQHWRGLRRHPAGDVALRVPCRGAPASHVARRGRCGTPHREPDRMVRQPPPARSRCRLPPADLGGLMSRGG